MSFPFHNQDQDHTGIMTFPAPQSVPNVKTRPHSSATLAFCFTASAQFNSEGCLPHRTPSHVSNLSWEIWLPGSWLLLCDLSGLVRKNLNLEMWNTSGQKLAEMVTIPYKVSINWYFLRIAILPAPKNIKYQKIWLLTKVEWFQWALGPVKHNCRQFSFSTLCHWLAMMLYINLCSLFWFPTCSMQDELSSCTTANHEIS